MHWERWISLSWLLCLHSTVFLYIMFLVSFTSNILVSWWVVSGPHIVDFGAYQSWTPVCKSWQVPVLVLACQHVKQGPWNPEGWCLPDERKLFRYSGLSGLGSRSWFFPIGGWCWVPVRPAAALLVQGWVPACWLSGWAAWEVPGLLATCWWVERSSADSLDSKVVHPLMHLPASASSWQNLNSSRKWLPPASLSPGGVLAASHRPGGLLQVQQAALT